MTGRGRTCDAPRFKRALYRLSYGHVNGRSRARTGGLLLIREALCQLSYPPSTSQTIACLSSPRRGARRTCGALRSRMNRQLHRRRSCLRHSPTLRPWIAGSGHGVLRGGVLEPGAHTVSSQVGRAKVTRTYTRANQRHIVEDLSLSGGASSGIGTFQAEHHLLVGSG